MKSKVSPEMAAQAMQTAKGIQKKGQTKAQTKLIAQGIEKGIAEYKKQQGKKLREMDKQRKQKARRQESEIIEDVEEVSVTHARFKTLPWVLLVLSWLGFIAYICID